MRAFSAAVAFALAVPDCHALSEAHWDWGRTNLSSMRQ